MLNNLNTFLKGLYKKKNAYKINSSEGKGETYGSNSNGNVWRI